MRMTEESKQKIIKKISEIFEELPEYTGRVHGEVWVSVEGEIILSFKDPIKKELFELFKKRYVNT